MSKKTFDAGGMKVQFLIEGAETKDAISIFRCDFPAGARIPLAHSHDGFDETVVVLEGEMTMVVEGKPHTLGAGESIHIPRGVVHGFAVKNGASKRGPSGDAWSKTSTRAPRSAVPVTTTHPVDVVAGAEKTGGAGKGRAGALTVKYRLRWEPRKANSSTPWTPNRYLPGSSPV